MCESARAQGVEREVSKRKIAYKASRELLRPFYDLGGRVKLGERRVGSLVNGTRPPTREGKFSVGRASSWEASYHAPPHQRNSPGPLQTRKDRILSAIRHSPSTDDARRTAPDPLVHPGKGYRDYG